MPDLRHGHKVFINRGRARLNADFLFGLHSDLLCNVEVLRVSKAGIHEILKICVQKYFHFLR